MKKKKKPHRPIKRDISECKSVKLYFDIQAKPKQSFRIGRNKKTGGIIPYTDTKVGSYEQAIILLAKPQLKGIQFTGAMMYTATYVFKVPKSYPKWCHDSVNDGFILYKDTKPDVDSNLNKGIIDAIAPLIMEDDSRIAVGYVRKVYGLKASISCEFKELPNPVKIEEL